MAVLGGKPLIGPDEDPAAGYKSQLRSSFDKEHLQLRLGRRVAVGKTEWVTLFEYDDHDPGARGQAQRDMQMLGALCHFLNAGGDTQFFSEVFNQLPPGFLQQFSPPPPWYLLYTNPIEGDPYRFEHVFATPSGEARIWAEGLEFAETTLADMLVENDLVTQES